MLSFAFDASWEESKHPRAANGQFGKHSSLPISTSNWKKIKDKKGSNPGGVYQLPNGEQWYAKESKSDDHAKNEHLANRLYEKMGVPVLDNHYVNFGSKLGTATPMVPLKNFDPKNKDDVKAIRKNFAAHVLLANWDAIGLDYDNQRYTDQGMTTIDAGGALNYRAQGTPKGDAFGHSAEEWDTLRDPKNPQAHKIFGGITPQEMKESAAAVEALTDADIEKLVMTHGPGSMIARAMLTNKLIARRDDIIARAGVSAKPKDYPDVSHFYAGQEMADGEALHGVPFKPEPESPDWNKHPGINKSLQEPEFPEILDHLGKPKRRASGVIMHEPDGRVWLVKPKNGYGGYKWTFPKGGVDDGISPQGNAIKEAWEESGLTAAIDGHHDDVEGDTSVTRFYKGHRTGGSPDAYGDETSGTALVHPKDLLKYLNRSRDRKFAIKHLGTPDEPHPKYVSMPGGFKK